MLTRRDRQREFRAGLTRRDIVETDYRARLTRKDKAETEYRARLTSLTVYVEID